MSRSSGPCSRRSDLGRHVPYSRQHIDDEDIRAVEAALRSDFLTQGPRVAAFEQALAECCQARYAVVFSSGTAALHAAYAAAGIGAGDEIVTSPITFAATGNAALILGARPVFADVESDTANLDVACAEAAIGPRTKALVPVDYAGHPVDLDAFRALAKRHDLVLIEDAAHALGARYRDRPVGGQADMTILSFHPVKAITTGEGGAVLTNDASWRERLVMFRQHGMQKEPERLERPAHGDWYHEMQSLGLNYRLTDIQCALGLSQLARLDRFVGSRRETAARYAEAFADLPGVHVPPERDHVRSAFHLYPMRFDVEGMAAKARLFRRMREEGLGVQVHYIPVYLHPYYQALGYAEGLCPVSERFYRQVVSIPLYAFMDEADVDHVIRTVRTLAEAIRPS